MGFLNCGSFIVHALLPGTSKAFTMSVFLPGAHIYVILLGTQQYFDVMYLYMYIYKIKEV